VTPQSHSKEEGFATDADDCTKVQTGMYGKIKTFLEICEYSGLGALIEPICN